MRIHRLLRPSLLLAAASLLAAGLFACLYNELQYSRVTLIRELEAHPDTGTTADWQLPPFIPIDVFNAHDGGAGAFFQPREHVEARLSAPFTLVHLLLTGPVPLAAFAVALLAATLTGAFVGVLASGGLRIRAARGVSRRNWPLPLRAPALYVTRAALPLVPALGPVIWWATFPRQFSQWEAQEALASAWPVPVLAIAASFMLATLVGFARWRGVGPSIAFSLGLCARCAYPVDPSMPRCPECGARPAAQPSTTRLRVPVILVAGAAAFALLLITLEPLERTSAEQGPLGRVVAWCLLRPPRYGPPIGCLCIHPGEPLVLAWPDGAGLLVHSYSITPLDYTLRQTPTFRHAYASAFFPGRSTPGPLSEAIIRQGFFTNTSSDLSVNWVARAFVGDHELRTLFTPTSDSTVIATFVHRGLTHVVRPGPAPSPYAEDFAALTRQLNALDSLPLPSPPRGPVPR